MTLPLADYELSLLAKSKGFNIGKCPESENWYDNKGKLPHEKGYNSYTEQFCQAPYLAELQQWLREERRLNVFVEFDLDWYGHRINTHTNKKKSSKAFDTHDQALSAAITTSLETLPDHE